MSGAHIAVEVALGRRPADLVLAGGTLVNVFTGELLGGWGVATAGELIAYVGPAAEDLAGPDTRVIPLRDRYLLPGFIDGHTHLDALATPERYLAAMIARGTTAVVTETTYLANTGGAGAVRAFLHDLAALPLHVFGSAPMTSLFCSDRGDGEPLISADEVADLLEEPGIVGLGEAYWPHVLEGRRDVDRLVRRARDLGKTAEGHSAGARDRKLAAYGAAGMRSCHEPIRADEVLERLRLGFGTMVREGSIRQDLGSLRTLVGKGIDFRRLALVTDGMWPPDLVARGHMDAVVRRAIEVGVSPVQAIQAVTIAPAMHFRLDDRIGGLAPGRFADLQVVTDLAEMRAELVCCRGRLVAQDGVPVVEIPTLPELRRSLPAPRLCRRLGADDFRVAGRGSVRIIEYMSDLVTREVRGHPPERDGALGADPGEDVIKVAAIDRHGVGLQSVGFAKGLGLREGAAAVSLSFDVNNLVVAGVADADMALAVNQVVDMGGGFAYARSGEVIWSISLPVGGIMSDDPIPVLAEQMRRADAVLRAHGCRAERPLLALQALTFTAVPALRIRERGLLDVRGWRLLELGGDPAS